METPDDDPRAPRTVRTVRSVRSVRPVRPRPVVTKGNAHFWTGGAEGELRFLRCRACRTFVHPPGPVCPACLDRELGVEATDGRATVVTYTVNHQPWLPGFPPPYVIAIVELDAQPGLRLTTNVVGCDPGAVHVGQRVRVRFEHHGDVWIPLFEPDER